MERFTGVVGATTVLWAFRTKYGCTFFLKNWPIKFNAMLDAFTPNGSAAFSLKRWASENNLTYRTAWRMFHEKRLPNTVRAEQLPTGTIRIYLKEKVKACRNGQTVVYARINPRQCRNYLEAQVEACKSFCFSSGWGVTEVVREIAPGIGHRRRKLTQLLSTPPSRLVILTPAVLSRFDFHLIKQLLLGLGCEVTVLDQSQEINNQGGALEDVVDAISVTCSLHYGVKKGMLLVDELKKLLRRPGVGS